MHKESFAYRDQLRSLQNDAVNYFISRDHSVEEAIKFMNNLSRMELYCVNGVTEDYILNKRLGVGRQMRSIMDGRDKSLKGVAAIGGFCIDGKTSSECVELIMQQADYILQRSLDYIDRWESYAAMFDALPNFKPKAA